MREEILMECFEELAERLLGTCCDWEWFADKYKASISRSSNGEVTLRVGRSGVSTTQGPIVSLWHRIDRAILT